MSTPPLPPPESLPPPPHIHNKSSLYKHNSWSPDILREEIWIRHQANQARRSKSVTDEDVDELKACFELGFGFHSPEIDHRLSETFPAYGLYYNSVVNNQYNNNNNNGSVSKRVSDSSPHSSNISKADSSSTLGSPEHAIVSPGDDPETVKTKLKQWAQLVACSVPQFSK